MSKKADTPAKQRQWKHVEQQMEDSGASLVGAIKAANAAVRDHPAGRKKRPRDGADAIGQVG